MQSLIVMALPQESQGRIEALTDQLLYTGVGKVNATLQLSAHLMALQQQNQRPKRVLNLGSAGSHQFSLLELVNCTHFVQQDMDATALGFALGQTPFETHSLLASGERIAYLPQAYLHSGDQFITDASKNLPVMDMEGYALAKVCLHFGVPFSCVKFISDNANQHSAMSWHDRLEAGSQRLATFLHAFLHADK
jgi:adenosylhomocysteine nucleosidase